MTAIIEDAEELKVNKWGTLNTVASPNKLPEGHSPRNNNVWMDEKPGSVITANGYILLGTLPSNLPPTFGIDFYKTSDGTSRFVVSDGQNVYQTTNYVDYTTITTGLSEFFQLRGAVIRDKLWLTNGDDPVMTWDGSTLVELDGTGGTPNVPLGKYIVYHDERVWIYGIEDDLSSARFTALTDTAGTIIDPDNASAWPSDNELQISEGDADIGTGMFIYRGYLYFSKQYSLWRLVGYDEYTYDRVKTRSTTGTRFQESIQTKDNLVYFIGVDGMYTFDGEESTRISDIIDPASSEEGTFAFRNLQQPLLNNNFWSVSDTAEFNTGTVPANLSTASDEASLVPADDSAADFNAGTNSDTSTSENPGSVQLDYQSSGGSTTDSALGGTAALPGGSTLIGVASSINDGSEASACGYRQTVDGAVGVWQVFFAAGATHIGSVTIAKFYFERAGSALAGSAKIQYSPDGATWADVPGGTVSLPASTVIPAQSYLYYFGSTPGGTHNFVNETDLSVSFSDITAYGIRLVTTIDRGNVAIKELYTYRTPFALSGTFLSKSLDYSTAPASYGELAASITTNGETYQFFTESSPDGSTWDAPVNVSNGGSIGSALQRYLRWGVTFTSAAGLNTPVVSKVYVGGTYLSEIHDTGGNIFAWAPFQMVQNKAGQTIDAYYRAAPDAGTVLATPWTAIVPGAVIGATVNRQFVQIKIEFSTADATQAPSVQSFAVHWTVGSGAGVNTLQNVASVVWLNRYWLTAATLGADSNDIVVINGKITFDSPWTTKDWNILMFCRFQNILIGGSSIDGTLYRLDYGYSKAGESMDSYYETADLGKDNFQIKGRELLVTADRSGPYDLAVGISTDGGINWTDYEMDLTRDSGESLSVVKKFNVSWMSDSVRFRVRTNAADQPFSVDELLTYYKLSPQRGTLE